MNEIASDRELELLRKIEALVIERQRHVPYSVPQPCTCGSARHAVDDKGRPVVLWSEKADPTNWDEKRS